MSDEKNVPHSEGCCSRPTQEHNELLVKEKLALQIDEILKTKEKQVLHTHQHKGCCGSKG